MKVQRRRWDVTYLSIQDFEGAVSEFRFAAYAKDEELIAAYNQVIHFKRIVDRLDPQVLKLQGVLKINESLFFWGLHWWSIRRCWCPGWCSQGEAPDGAAAENVAAAEGVATE